MSPAYVFREHNVICLLSLKYILCGICAIIFHNYLTTVFFSFFNVGWAVMMGHKC